MKTIALRLQPGQDLRGEIEALVEREGIDAGVVLTCVGSLSRAVVRPAGRKEPLTMEQEFEIVSLVGTLSPEGCHLHISVSDELGVTMGGHLSVGCVVRTTAEIVVGVLADGVTELVGAGVKLRPWRRGDEESLLKYANNRKVSIHLRDRFPYPYTRVDADNWISIANQGRPLQNFAIEVGGDAVGGIGIILGEDIFRCSAEIGYWLGEPFWGRGLMTEAVKLMTEYTFREFGLHRIWAGIFEGNPASGRVLEKAGYVFESRNRKALIKEGVVYDQLMYVVVR